MARRNIETIRKGSFDGMLQTMGIPSRACPGRAGRKGGNPRDRVASEPAPNTQSRAPSKSAPKPHDTVRPPMKGSSSDSMAATQSSSLSSTSVKPQGATVPLATGQEQVRPEASRHPAPVYIVPGVQPSG